MFVLLLILTCVTAFAEETCTMSGGGVRLSYGKYYPIADEWIDIVNATITKPTTGAYLWVELVTDDEGNKEDVVHLVSTDGEKIVISNTGTVSFFGRGNESG